MRKISKIATLDKYEDWLEKSKHEFSVYKKSYSVYDLANCLLTLNALPEWIEKSEGSPESLRNIASLKISIMKGDEGRFVFDETKLDLLDQQLRMIRLFCNHAKHGIKKTGFIKISTSTTTFPIGFPMKFEMLEVGNTHIKASDVIENIISFWEQEIEKA